MASKNTLPDDDIYRKKIVEEDLINGFDFKILDDFIRVMKGKLNIFMWIDEVQLVEVVNYMRNRLGSKLRFHIFIWHKHGLQLNRRQIQNDLEFGLYLYEGQYLPDNGLNDYLNRVYRYGGNQEQSKYNHPTVKPLEIVEYHIKHLCPLKNGVVLDPFIGSGTTAVACNDLGISCIGFEKNPEYFKLAQKRVSGKIFIPDNQMTLF